MNEEKILFKKRFFEQAENDIQNVNLTKIFYLVEKAVKTGNKQLIDYGNIISIGSENKGRNLKNNEDYKNLLFKIYKIWWNNWLVPNSKSEQYKGTYTGEKIDALVSEPIINPNSENFSGNIFDILAIINHLDINQNAWYFQYNSFCLLDVFNFFKNKQNGFRYCDARLYLNLKFDNIPKLANVFVDKAIEKDVPLLFKFALQDSRTDNMVLYVKYKDIQRVVDLIEETKKENPDLFEGCKVKNPLMPTYKGYMGFGEEPYVYGSYTSERVNVLKKMYQYLSKEYAKDKNSLTKTNISKAYENACNCLNIDPHCFYKNAPLKYLEDSSEELTK